MLKLKVTPDDQLIKHVTRVQFFSLLIWCWFYLGVNILQEVLHCLAVILIIMIEYMLGLFVVLQTPLEIGLST